MSDIFRDYSFGGQLKHLRLERGESLREFGRRVGICPSNYSALENGRMSPPTSFKRVKKLLDKLEVPKENQKWLIGLAYEHHLGGLRQRFKGSLDK